MTGDATTIVTVEPVAVTKAVAADMLGLSVRTIDTLIAGHDLAVLRVGRAVRVPVTEIRRFVAERAAHVAAREDAIGPDGPTNADRSSPRTPNRASTEAVRA